MKMGQVISYEKIDMESLLKAAKNAAYEAAQEVLLTKGKEITELHKNETDPIKKDDLIRQAWDILGVSFRLKVDLSERVR